MKVIDYDFLLQGQIKKTLIREDSEHGLHLFKQCKYLTLVDVLYLRQTFNTMIMLQKRSHINSRHQVTLIVILLN